MSASRIAAIACATLIGVLGAIQIADPATLGLSPQAIAWLGIVGTGLGIVQSFLPPVQRDAP